MQDVYDLPLGVRFDAYLIIREFNDIAHQLENNERKDIYQGDFYFPNKKHKISKDFFYNEKILEASKKDKKKQEKLGK